MIKRVVILCGPRPSYGFCPVPLLTDSAPEKNIFRISECDFEKNLEIFVISACSHTQKSQIITDGLTGNYINIPFPDNCLKINNSKLFNNKLIQIFSGFFLKTYDLFTWVYLVRASKVIKKIQPDVILINSFPQYMLFISKEFPGTKIGLFVRGEMGSSRKYLSLMDCIITNSKGISNYVNQLLSGKPMMIREIPNGLETSFSAERKIYSELTIKNIIYTGRIEPVKGILELLKAYKIVQERVHGVHLNIVGGNFNQNQLTYYESSLLKYAMENNLNVEFTGQVPSKDIPRFYLAAEIAVFPSIWLESFGMVALEAMRCGLPVIASRRPGFEELVVPGETGALVDDPSDTAALAEAIIKILNDPETAQRMGQNGYQRSLLYTPEVTTKIFEKIVAELFHK